MEVAVTHDYIAEYFVDDTLVTDRVGLVVGTDVFLKTHLNLTIHYMQ